MLTPHHQRFTPLLLLLLLLPSLPYIAESNDAFQKFQDAKQYLHSKSFFSGGDDALSWDTDDLSHARTLHDKKFDDEHDYMASFHLAEFLGLHMVESMHMPVPLNIIFIGFSGDGSMDVNVTKEQLVAWFEHLDHVLPHTRIALSDVSCMEDGHCSAFAKASAPPPLHSYVHLNFSCHVVDLDSRPVLHNFERAIAAFARPVDPKHETGMQQVDAVQMETFIDNFIKSLGFSEQYSLLVINPRWSAARPKYGYRTGVSREEIDFLTSNRVADSILGLRRKVAEMKPPEQKPLWSHSWDNPWTYPRQGAEKFKIHDAVWTADHWVTNAAEYLDEAEKYRSALLKMAGGQTGAAAQAHALKVLAHPEKREGAALLNAALLFNPESRRHRPHLPTSAPAEDCLTHSWVGHHRWLLLDLGAAGFEWGPALGGEGVVHPHTLPSVTEYFMSIREAKQGKAEEKATAKDAELRAHLDAAKAQRLGSIANKHYHAFFRQHQDRLQARPPNTHGELPPTDSLQQKWERHHSELLLTSELDVLEEFGLRVCHLRTEIPPICREARHRVEEIQHVLAAVTSTTGNLPLVVREHKWDIFGTENDENWDGDIITETMRQQDMFMARLSAALSRGIRHVIAPPSATWHHDGYMHDTATPYAHEVYFEFFIITDTSRRSAGRHPARPPSFDVEAFKAEIMGLKLTQQHFSFVTRSLSMQDDPQLATSFATCLRTAYQQVPLSKTAMHEFEQVYLDSHDLAAKLQQQFPAPRSRTKGQLHVPVFLFLLTRDAPVLIDQHYNARALEDTVLIVANSANKDEHPLGFTCGGKLQSRPSSPLKDALAAMLQHLGGVLPPHLGYRPYTRDISLDWSWSVGAHPFSATSTGTKYSLLQRDALFRSYLLDALDTSIDRVNDGLMALSKEPPEKGTFRQIQAHEKELRGMMDVYSQLVHLWHSTVTHSQQLGFASAAELIPSLLDLSLKFQAKCKEMHRLLHPLNCASRAGGAPFLGFLPHPIILLSGLVLLGAVAYIFYATHAITKPKLS